MSVDVLDLDAIEARVNAATRSVGWHVKPGRGMFDAAVEAYHGEISIASAVRQADAEFIAAARTDVPALVAEVRRLRALVGA